MCRQVGANVLQMTPVLAVREYLLGGGSPMCWQVGANVLQATPVLVRD